MNKKFNVEMTNFIKGIAVILMIIHHLFWNVEGYGIEICGHALSQRIGIISKVCVSIFLLLSGYGVFEKFKSNELPVKNFLLKRISKLYLNYLLIVIISVLFGIVFFRESFFNLIQPNLKGIVKIILTASGLQYIVGYQGFNPSWWFTTCIMLYYILTPLIKKDLDKYNSKFIIFTLILSCINFIDIGRLNCILNIISYLFPYTLGCYLSHNNNLNKLMLWFDNKIKRSLLIVLFSILLFLRQVGLMHNNYIYKLDFLLSLLIVLLVYIYYEKLPIKKSFIYLGNKSGDIYYIHMFISNYYLSNFIYSIKYPILMTLTVLIISLAVSYIIDLLRKSLLNSIKDYRLVNS